MYKDRLLYIVEAFGGGVFTYLVDLSNKLSDRYDIVIAYGLRKQTPDNFKNYFNSNVKFVRVEAFDRSINPFNDVKAFFELKRIAKKVKPDIIHLHSSKAGVLGRFAFGSKIPMFYTPHGYSFLMKNQNAFKRFVYKLIEKVSAWRPCTTISCSKGEHEETLKITKRAIYVNNGVNIQELDKNLKSLKVSNNFNLPTVFTLGRICYQKNPELFNEIALQCPNINFIWIGDGEMRNTLTAPNITITGWLERDQALEKAITADIFMLTSLWEGLPLSLLEAMYMKKTCIVSNVIGNKDVIKNNINGFVCDDLTDFVNAIQTAYSNNTDKLKEQAYNDIINYYNTEVMASCYDSIYRKAVGEKSLQ